MLAFHVLIPLEEQRGNAPTWSKGRVGRKAGERKVKMPLAAFGSLFRSEKTETDLENTLWVSLYR